MKNTLLALAIASTFGSTVVFAETEFSGVIEIEATYEDDGAEDSSDLAVATVELGIDHKLNDKVDGHLLFAYEDDEDIIVDEATINFHPNATTDIALGRQYVPFGSYESNMLFGPLTSDLSETEMDAVLIKKSLNDNFSGSAYVFQGSDDKISDGGVSLDYSSDMFNAGIGYITNADESDLSAVSVYANGTVGRTTLIAEHIQLEEEAGVQPTASHLEVGFDLGGDKVIALTAQQTDEAQALDLPERAYGIAYSMPIYENTGFTAEYINAENYDGSDVDSATLQVAYEF